MIGLPHDGIALPEHVAGRLTDSAKNVPDTDWFVSRLYHLARHLGASLLLSSYSRYLVDLMCPTVQFSGEPVYLPGQQPSSESPGITAGRRIEGE